MPTYRYPTSCKWGAGYADGYREIEAASAEDVVIDTGSFGVDLYHLQVLDGEAWSFVLDHMLDHGPRPYGEPSVVVFTGVQLDAPHNCTSTRIFDARYRVGGDLLGRISSLGVASGWKILPVAGGYPRAAAHSRGWTRHRPKAAEFLCYLANLTLEARS